MRGNYQPHSEHTGAGLQAYLLGSVDFEAVLLLQKRLHYDVAGDPTQGALVVCEHPPLITVGRQGSRRHLSLDPHDLQARQWRIRWVNRGGGCWLHLPGQLNIYPIVPVDRLGLTVPAFLERLGDVLRRVLDDFSVAARVSCDAAGVWVGDRLLAAIGVAVRDGVTYFGACFNLHPPLDAFRAVQSHPSAPEPMTSLERERRGPVSPSLVRERLLEHFRAGFHFERLALFSDHPVLHASPTPRRVRHGGRALGMAN